TSRAGAMGRRRRPARGGRTGTAGWRVSPVARCLRASRVRSSARSRTRRDPMCGNSPTPPDARGSMDDDIPLLNTPNLVALILRDAGTGGASADGCADRLARLFGAEPPLDRAALVAHCATHL